MAWQNELTIIVRTLINDLTAPYQFSDQRIIQCLVVAAKYVQFDVVLDHKYVVDVVSQSITPDPTDDSDDIFISLVALKAACIVDQSTYRTRTASEGIRAAVGPLSFSIGVGGSSPGKSWQMVLEHGPCALYDGLIEHWDVANATAVRAVLSPFIGNKFDPQNLSNRTNDYSRQSDGPFF